MPSRVSRTWLLAVALATVIGGHPGIVFGDAAQDFAHLKDQFDRQYGAEKYRDAEQTAVQLRRLAEGPLKPDRTYLATATYFQAIAVHDQGRYADAEPLYHQTLTIKEEIYGRDSPGVAQTLFWLGRLHEDQKLPQKAEPLYKRALAIREKESGPEHQDTVQVLLRLAGLYYYSLERYAEAEALYQRGLRIRKKALGPEHLDVAATLTDLGNLYGDQGRNTEAEQHHQQALAIRERALGPEHPQVADVLNNLAIVHNRQGHFADAERLHKRVLAIREKAHGPDHLEVAHCLNNLAEVYRTQGRCQEAIPLYQRSLAIKQKALPPDDLDLAGGLNNLGLAYQAVGRYGDAQTLLEQSLSIREKRLGPQSLEVALALNNLATLYDDLGRFAEEETLHKRALAIREKVLGAEHPEVAASLNNLTVLYHALGRYAEAEPLGKRALALKEMSLGAHHPSLATTLNTLGNLYLDQGRYADAEGLYQRALAIRRKAFAQDNAEVADTVNNLAILNKAQKRYAAAAALYQEALAIREKVLGPDHPAVAASLNNLASLREDELRYAEAERLYQRALAIKEKALGPEHPDVAASLNNLALLYQYQNRDADAEQLYERARKIKERHLGPEHPEIASADFNLALLREHQERYADAEPLVDRSVAILERTRSEPAFLLKCYALRARLGWHAQRRGEAVADLRRALELAEQLRGQSSGSAHERASFFAGFTGIYENMVAWQTELGDASEVLTAMERARARSLLDDLNLSGADLHVGRPAAEREQLRQREAELKTQVSGLERQLGAAGEAAEGARLQAALAAARESLYQHYRDERSTSPVYRQLLAVGTSPVRLSRVQQQLVGPDGWLLVYFLGEKQGFVLSAGKDFARVDTLTVEADAAQALGIAPGPLTAQRLREVLVRDDRRGVLQQLATADGATQVTGKLAALWRLLVPEASRQALTEGKVKRLILVPDGPLALLPFETLVIRSGEAPRYLLEVGPPIQYGPSATIIYNLSQRATVAPAQGGRALTVGDPAYTPRREGAAPGDSVSPTNVPARYAAGGGRLTPLPYTAWESTWVADTFRKQGWTVEQLVKDHATKANVRREAVGRQFLHLACHGLVDQAYGNLFGALALTPGGRTDDPADDGFLTLAEIYELELKDCEVAVLSACETNFGPQQQGEGVWALSRGFLVAGARRVVASNWLVDDEAAAHLVNAFCGDLAAESKDGAAVDYAAALHRAKRWLRQQEKWHSPYYWGTFVLIGPK